MYARILKAQEKTERVSPFRLSFLLNFTAFFLWTLAAARGGWIIQLLLRLV